jgi:hypothetical protein
MIERYEERGAIIDRLVDRLLGFTFEAPRTRVEGSARP